MSDNVLKPVMIFGASSMGKVALEIFKSNRVVVYGFLDDDEKLHGQTLDEVSVLGRTDDGGFLKLIGQKCDAFVATDENALRQGLVEMLKDKRKVMPVNALHPASYLATTASLGHGNLLNAGVLLGSEAHLGSFCILHSRVVVDHEAKIGDFVQIGAGSIINAKVEIEAGAFIGSGVTIVSGIKIGENARVGAGSVVVESVPKGATVFGNPAQKLGKA